LTSFVS